MAYKIKKEKERLELLTVQISENEATLGELNQQLAAVRPIKAEFDEISAIGKKKRLTGNVEMNTDEYEKLQNLAKEGLTSQMTKAALNRQIEELRRRIWAQKEEFDKRYDATKDFFRATRLAPDRVRELFADILTYRREVLQKQSKWNVEIDGKDAR